MTSPSASVVIVSRHRPSELRKCLLALSFQTLPCFEVIVVGDPETGRVIEALKLQDKVKQSLFDAPNISQARNIGIGLAAGKIVAFIDDDAVAEPTWLERLIAPFDDDAVAASGGFVRGRNGISYQWKAEAIGLSGDSEHIEVTKTSVLEGTEYRAIKTQGTNCAFRRDILEKMGGFDENYHFYMDETDLNMRIAHAGLLTAIVPDAEVQHGYAQSAQRTQNRAPRTLYDLGASRAYFLKKFGQDLEKVKAFRLHQRKRLLRHMVNGEIEPRDVNRLLATFDDGVAQGIKRDSIHAKIGKPSGFVDFARPQEHQHLSLFARRRNRATLFAKAREHASRGVGVTAMVFTRTALFHRRWFHRDGFWVQTGGQFGKSDRSDPIFRRYSTRVRAQREHDLLTKTRPMTAPAQRP